VKNGMDAGVRFGAGNWPRVHAEKMFDEWLVPVCTGELLRRHGTISDAHDLKHYKLLHSPYEPWSAWLLEGESNDVWPSTGPLFDDAVAIVRAADGGQGLALARWSLVADEVSRQRLVVAGRSVKSPRAWYFVCPPSHLAMGKVSAFREWLIDECRHFPAPPRPGTSPERKA
jgi:LysR family glycine cleavage system transcriptional activator